jgi:uncharacterized protein YqeY
MLVDALTKEAKASNAELDEQGEIAVLKRERKRRLEAAEAFRKGGRDESAASEDAEAAMIDAYLPAQLSEEDLKVLVAEAVTESGATGPQEMGKVMPVAMGKVAGRADGKRVSALVKELLTA